MLQFSHSVQNRQILQSRTLRLVLAALAAWMPGQASAVDGTWRNATTNSTWNTPGNWESAIAGGVDAIANFNTLNIEANRTVNLGAEVTVGKLIFGDTTASNNWVVSNGTGGPWTLTLQTSALPAPEIQVVNQNATINAILRGNQGLLKTGAGTLALTNAGNTLTGGITLSEGSLSFTTGALGTNTVNVTAASTIVWGTSTTEDISSRVILGDGATVSLNTGTNLVTLATALQKGPTGNAAVTKLGAGTLTLTAANTWTGGTRVSAGRLVLAGGNNRLAATGTVILGQGQNSGVLQLGDASGASNQTVTSLTIAGSGGANAVVGGNAAVSMLTVNVAGPASNSITYAGFLGGAGANENNIALTKSGAGTLVVNNAGNTFTGGVNIQAGSLDFATGALAGNTITFTGSGSLAWLAGNAQDVSASIVLNNGVTATLNTGANTITLASAFQAGTNNSVTKGGGGTLIITAANSWTNGTRVNNGRVILTGGDNRLSAAGAIMFGNGANSGILQLGDASGTSNQTVTGLSIIGTGTANAIVGGSSAISTLTVNTNGVVAFAGTLGGSVLNENNLALVKSGAGTLALGGNSTFLGDVTVTGGTLLITRAAALGGGTKIVSVAASTDTPSLQLDGTSGDIVLASNISYVTSNDDPLSPAILNKAGNNVLAGEIHATTGGAGSGHTRIKVNDGTLTLDGTIAPHVTAAADVTVIFDGSGNGTANGLIADQGGRSLSVTKEGSGTWTLNAANSYNGTTTVVEGRLNVSTAQTGGGALVVGDNTVLGLRLTGAGQTLNVSALIFGSSSGATLEFNLGALGNPLVSLLTTPSFTTNGITVLNISGTGLSVGQFGLIDYSGIIGGSGFAGLSLGTLPARVTAALLHDTAGTRVVLDITAFDVPRWTGAVDAKWDINDGSGSGTLNWQEVNSGLSTRYLQGAGGIDSVLFDDTAGVPTNVELTTALTPATVTVNASVNAFTFEGDGKLGGTTNVVKLGSSVLTFAERGINDYTGTTTISGGTLRIGDGTTAGAGHLGGGDVINNATLAFDRPDTLSVANSISGSGAIVQQGAGAVTLSGNNAGFDGTIIITAGSLVLGNLNALGSTVGDTTVGPAGILEVGGFSLAENIHLQAGGTLRNDTGTTAVLSGAILLDGGGTVQVEGSTTRLTFSTPITGTGGLTKTGAGTLILTGENTYAGDTVIQNGTLQIGATGGAGTSSSLPTGDIHFASVDPSDVATLAILRAGSINFAQNITSSGPGAHSIVIGVVGASSPSGEVTFSGTNTFTGNVTVSGGTLRITNSSALGTGAKVIRVAANSLPSLVLDGSGGDITLAAGIHFQLSSDGSGTTAGALVSAAGNNTIHGRISMVNGGGGQARIMVQTGTLVITGNVDAETATGNRTLFVGGAGSGSITGVISDTGVSVVGLSKDGTGTWRVTNDNTFTGAVSVSDGVLQFATAAATGTAQSLGQGTAAVNLGSATTSGTLEYIGTADALLGRGLTVAGVGGGIVRNSHASAVLTIAGTVTKNGRPLTLTGGHITVTGQVTGNTAGDLIIDASVTVLSNTANNYAGTTRVIGGGTLRNGASEVLTNGTTLVLGDAATGTGGTYDLGGFSETIAALSGAGTGQKTVTNSGSALSTLTVTGTSTFDGVIQDGSVAAVSLVKSTGGTFTLTGANTYTGETSVTGGALQVGTGGSGASSTDASARGRTGTGLATVSSSGVLSGTGLVQGDLRISGGQVRAGDGTATAGDALGTLWVGGNVAFEAGTLVFQVKSTHLNSIGLADSTSSGYASALADLSVSLATELASPVATTSYDHLEFAGTFDWTATGARAISVVLEDDASVAAGDVFNLLDWLSVVNGGSFNAGAAIRLGGKAGTDLLLPSLADGLAWDTTLFTEHGILIVTQFDAVPEPSRALLLLGAMGAVLFRRRRSLPGGSSL